MTWPTPAGGAPRALRERIMIRNAQVGQNAVEGGQGGGEKFARSLIASLGFKGAVHACEQNCWDGILKIILAHKDDLGPARD